MYQIDCFEVRGPRVVTLPVRAGAVIRVGQGSLWLTLQGQPQDVWLQRGQTWTVPVTSQLWLSAEPAATFELVHALVDWPLGRHPQTPPGGWLSSLARWRRICANLTFSPRIHYLRSY